MAQGRGSAHVAMAVVLLCLLVHCEIAQAATYTVGDSGGWTFNVVNWPNGKRFSAGDVLVFKYSPAIHNVVAVTRNGYSGCTTPRGSKVFKSGNDRITLARGQNFFICNFVGHCQGGMKIAVNAA
ncbi:basic blue protein-like [Tasmannia lanceolata]|uniref:basic blue protein-like n=1 Tax=Tasmannia lanceolata TaxID=3420 RepID=UPI0040648149